MLRIVEATVEPIMAGIPARRIARRLRCRGTEVLGTEGFLVEDAEGSLEDREPYRAHAWGQQLADLISVDRSGRQRRSRPAWWASSGDL